MQVTFTAVDIAALKWAAKKADEWYGSVTGDRDAEKAHLAAMDLVEEALRKLKVKIKRRK